MIAHSNRLDAKDNMFFGLGPSMSEAVEGATSMNKVSRAPLSFTKGGREVKADLWIKGGKTYFKLLFNHFEYTNEEASIPPKNNFWGTQLRLV